jgi:SH3-like domain-containing protein
MRNNVGRRRLAPAPLGLLLLLLVVDAAAAARAGETGLPLPRFASLRSDEVNMRSGPGLEYPVEWVMLRPGLPVEIIAEFEHWRRIRDADGAVGWVHRTMLSGDRTLLVTGSVRTLYSSPDPASPPVLRAEPGVIGELISCDETWCRAEIAGEDGWIERAHIWGVEPGEVVE